MMPMALVLLSGGLDSLVCTHLLREQGWGITALFVDYGQKAQAAEMTAVRNLAEQQKLELETAKIVTGRVFDQGLILGRNSALISLALLSAEPRHTGIAIGIHSGTDYYDCSAKYFQRMSTLVVESSSGKMELLAPLLNWSKAQIAEYAIEKRLPIKKSYSCENGTLPPCGDCMSCKDRSLFEC